MEKILPFKFVFVLFALFLFALPFVTAQNFDVKVKGLTEADAPISVTAGETVPITLVFKTLKDFEDIVAKAELNYSNGKVYATSASFDISENTTYILDGDKALYLGIPADIKEADESASIIITLEDEDGDAINDGIEYKKVFGILIQRENNKLEIKSITIPGVFNAGERTLISVGVKNTGANSQDNVYVEARIPALGIISERLLGYLSSKSGNENNEATIELPLILPEQIRTGVYSLKVRAFNDKVSEEQATDIQIKGLEKEILLSDITPLKAIQDVEQGKRTIYKIIILNLGTKEQTYTINIKDAEDWATAQANPATVTLGKDSSSVVEIYIAPKENVIGEKTFKTIIKANNELVKQVDFVADVKKTEEKKLDPFVTSLIGAAIIAFFLILIFMGLRIRGDYKIKLKAVEAISEAKEVGRKAAKEEATELVSDIMGKVLEAEEKHLEVAKERAAGRTHDVIEGLREDEIEEVVSKAVQKLGEKKTDRMNKKEKENMYETIKNNADDIIHKITHKLGEKDLDDVVDKVAEKLSEEEVEEVGVDKTIETLVKLKEKLGSQIEKLKVEEEEEVVKKIEKPAKKKAGAKKAARKGRKTKIKKLKKAAKKFKKAKKIKKKAVKKAVKRAAKKSKKAKKHTRPKAKAKITQKLRASVTAPVTEIRVPITPVVTTTSPVATRIKSGKKKSKKPRKGKQEKFKKKEKEAKENPVLEKIVTKEITRKF